PKRTSTRTMGPSHHFLRTRRKSQTSRAKDGWVAGLGTRQTLPWAARLSTSAGTYRVRRALCRGHGAVDADRGGDADPAGDPPADAVVTPLIELALKAPTGSNAQSWEFVVVRDRAVKERLGTLNRQAWSLYGGLGRRLYRNDPTMLRIMNAVQWQVDHFGEIPVLVIPGPRGLIPPWPPLAGARPYRPPCPPPPQH